MKNKFAILVAELFGTLILTLVYVSVQHSGIGYPLFIGLGAAAAVGGLVMVFARTSGAQLNPALTFGLWTNRKVKTAPAIMYIAMQIAGGAIAWPLYDYLAKSPLQSLTGNFSVKIMVAQAIGMFIFAIAWSAAAAQKYVGWRLAVTAGGGFALAIIVASIGSYGFANPAIALGDHAWAWGNYVLGPAIGGLVGVNFYNLLFTSSGFGFNKPQTAKIASTASSSTTAKKPAKQPTKKPAKKAKK
ncbi:MAG: aquaporin [Candidatus Saccharimonadales bacterium]